MIKFYFTKAMRAIINHLKNYGRSQEAPNADLKVTKKHLVINFKSRKGSQKYLKRNLGNLNEFPRKKNKNGVRILKMRKLAAKYEKVFTNNRNT